MSIERALSVAKRADFADLLQESEKEMKLIEEVFAKLPL